uniref:BLOC-1-related complex subunit 5 n=1 Tax=Octopus bimaculoides TaxID=37653 RepID=A0A0L8I4U2_OCTBM
MGSEQSSLPAGAPGSSLRSQRDEDIPYTTYSISKPIDGGNAFSIIIDYMMHVLLNSLTDRQRKYAKYTEQFQRVSETLSILNRIKGSIDNIIPKMERLNQMLPETEQLEPFTMKSLPSN